jgi:putative MFS transporter
MASTAAAPRRDTIHGLIAARIDRLPLTAVQWRLAILVQVTWGFIIFDTDGVASRLYPFVWRPHHIITVNQYAVLQALQVGLGILLGAFLMSWAADRYGRRVAILLATLLGGMCIWPFAYVTNFGAMVVLSVLSTLGAGGIIATQAVYLSEMTSSAIRNKLLLSSQGVTALVAASVNLLAFWLIPGHWQAFLWVSAAVLIVVLLPLVAWLLPESPRWLETHGHHAEADRVVGEFEERCRRAIGRPLPDPDQGMHPVIVAEKGAWREIFFDQRYRGRTIAVLVCWLLSYSGMIYGSGSFIPVYMVDHGASAHFVFLTFVITALVVFCGFQVNARISDAIERRDVLCVMACLFAATFLVVYLVPNLWVIATFFVIGRIGVGLWVFNLYNYTAVAYPTRIRATAFAWTDGLGHLGAWGGVTLLGPLYAWGPNHLGWALWALIPGALIPAIVIRTLGIKQSRIVLEQVST